MNENAGPLRITSVNRVITVNPWGYIKVAEEHTLISYGLYPINTFTITVPDKMDLLLQLTVLLYQ